MLEGYPLFGLYQVTFPPSYDFKKDLVLRFFYQSPLYGARQTPEVASIQFSCADAHGLRTKVSSAEVALVLGKDATGKPSLPQDAGCSLLEASP